MHVRVIGPALRRAEAKHAQTHFTDYLDFVDAEDWKYMVDWIVRAHASYALRTFSLHLAPLLVARFLQTELVPWQQHSLLAAAALLVAAKFEDENYPDMAGLAYMGMGRFTPEEVQIMELRLLRRVGFRLHVPTSAHHLAWFQVICGGDGLQAALTEYIVEVGLSRVTAARWAPSLHAGAAAILGAALLRRSAPEVITCLCETAARSSHRRPASSSFGSSSVLPDGARAKSLSHSAGEALDAVLAELKVAILETEPKDAIYEKFATEERYFASLKAVQLLMMLGA